VIVLNKVEIQTGLIEEEFAVEAFHEKAPIVLKNLRLNQ
jgi:hypothetical protein